MQQHRGALGLLGHGLEGRGIQGDIRDFLVFQQDAVALLRGGGHGSHRQADGASARLLALDGHQIILGIAHAVGDPLGGDQVVVLIFVVVASSGGGGSASFGDGGGSGSNLVSTRSVRVKRQLLIVNPSGNLLAVIRHGSAGKGCINGNRPQEVRINLSKHHISFFQFRVGTADNCIQATFGYFDSVTFWIRIWFKESSAFFSMACCICAVKVARQRQFKRPTVVKKVVD